MTVIWLLITLFIPLLGAIINGFFGHPFKKYAHLIAVPAIGISWLSSLPLLKFALRYHAFSVNLYTWIPVDPFRVSFGLLLDPLSAIMVTTVTTVSFFVHLYSIEYMEGDPGYRRFFAYLNLFVFSMLLLVLANNFLLLFVGWEGVGLCSYLLISHWYEKKSARDAGKKAFIVNRIGDAGFIIGIFTLFALFGSVNYLDIFPKVGTQPAPLVVTAALFLFIGAIGKSAQFPLYVWLPDAMEGPTPVSALIHAATMVTAGVYMVARSSALYSVGPEGLVSSVGAFTAIFAALLAICENDMKRVLAYSTISQLGYMFIGVGIGAYAVGIFHLFTHAFFKALLFLSAGSVMHGLKGELNIQKMGGLIKKLPWTGVFFIIGAIALAGIPPGAGFFSKDLILEEALLKGHPVIYWIGTITVLLTAFYIFRLVFLVFFGEPRKKEIYKKAHEPSLVMLIPLFFLAIGSISVGFLGVGIHGRFMEVLTSVFVRNKELTGLTGFVRWLPLTLGVLGVIIAYTTYILRVPDPEVVSRRAGILYRVVFKKFYVDEIYALFVTGPLYGISKSLKAFLERGMIDGTVNGTAAFIRALGNPLRKWATGTVRTYAFWILAGAVITLWLLMGGGAH